MMMIYNKSKEIKWFFLSKFSKVKFNAIHFNFLEKTEKNFYSPTIFANGMNL